MLTRIKNPHKSLWAIRKTNTHDANSNFCTILTSVENIRFSNKDLKKSSSTYVKINSQIRCRVLNHSLE